MKLVVDNSEVMAAFCAGIFGNARKRLLRGSSVFKVWSKKRSLLSFPHYGQTQTKTHHEQDIQLHMVGGYPCRTSLYHHVRLPGLLGLGKQLHVDLLSREDCEEDVAWRSAPCIQHSHPASRTVENGAEHRSTRESSQRHQRERNYRCDP